MSKICKEELLEKIEQLKKLHGYLPIELIDVCEAYRARGYQFACEDIVNFINSLPECDENEFPKGKVVKTIPLKVSDVQTYNENGEEQDVMFVIKPSKDLNGDFKVGQKYKMVLMTEE